MEDSYFTVPVVLARFTYIFFALIATRKAQDLPIDINGPEKERNFGFYFLQGSCAFVMCGLHVCGWDLKSWVHGREKAAGSGVI